jgi:hypothetical protein
LKDDLLVERNFQKVTAHMREYHGPLSQQQMKLTVTSETPNRRLLGDHFSLLRSSKPAREPVVLLDRHPNPISKSAMAALTRPLSPLWVKAEKLKAEVETQRRRGRRAEHGGSLDFQGTKVQTS